MHMSYQPKGICAAKIDFDVEDGKVYNVKFSNGCDGNHKGLANLVEGMSVEEVSKKLRGITCGHRTSSCPDQLAQAMENYLKQSF